MNIDESLNLKRKAKKALTLTLDVTQAVDEIKQQLGEDDSNLILFFASTAYDPDKISAEFQKRFPDSITVGCTTAGELFEGELLKDSIVAMAFNKEIIKNCSIAIIEDLNNVYNVNKAFDKFESDFGVNLLEVDPAKYVGMILVDGLSYREESLVERINELTEITFTGGSAGDDWKMVKTYLYANGKSYEHSAILILLEPTYGFKILKTENFKPFGQVFKATEVDTSKRCVKKFNDKPAALFYAEQMGKHVDEIQNYFKDYSIGIVIGNESFIHEPKTIDKDYNIYLYSAIPKGAEVQILKSTNIFEETKMFLDKKVKIFKNISAVINFNCMSRTKTIYDENLQKEHSEIYKNMSVIGFSTYGEYYFSFNNQTSVLLIFF